MGSTCAALDTGEYLKGHPLRMVLLDQYGGRCVWCGHRLSADDECCTVDHLVPRVGKNGAASRLLANMAPAHYRCNRRRGTLGVADWLIVCERRGKRPNRRAIVAALRQVAETDTADGASNHARKQLRLIERDSSQPRWTFVGNPTIPYAVASAWSSRSS